MPSLSTADEVTAISGRGVGMDVVRANIERIGGVVDVDSRPSQGVKLCIRVPLTLTIIPALTVSAGGQVFAVPRSAIDEILRVGGAVRIDRVGEAEVATVRGRRVPLIGLPRAARRRQRHVARDEQKLVLLKPAGGDVYALAVDAVHDHEELVVKPAAPAVMAAGLYAGTTLADDGSPILLLDPSGMAKRAGIDFAESEIDRALHADAAEAEAARETSLLLFRTLDGGRRAVPVGAGRADRGCRRPRRSASAPAGCASRSATRILPLAGCAAAPADRQAAHPAAHRRRDRDRLWLRRGDRHPLARARSAAARRRRARCAGVALVDGDQVELLDPHWLFAAHARRRRGATPRSRSARCPRAIPGSTTCCGR